MNCNRLGSKVVFSGIAQSSNGGNSVGIGSVVLGTSIGGRAGVSTLV